MWCSNTRSTIIIERTYLQQTGRHNCRMMLLWKCTWCWSMFGICLPLYRSCFGEDQTWAKCIYCVHKAVFNHLFWEHVCVLLSTFSFEWNKHTVNIISLLLPIQRCQSAESKRYWIVFKLKKILLEDEAWPWVSRQGLPTGGIVQMIRELKSRITSKSLYNHHYIF